MSTEGEINSLISVIIVTKDRDIALRTISLPSLLRQQDNNFEVIVWDASKTSDSNSVVDEFRKPFSERNASLRYFKAPRVGSASQRNDAMEKAEGNILFFVDDDCDVSPDAITGLRGCFADHPGIMGGSPPLREAPDEEEMKWQQIIKEKLYKMIGYKRKRTVAISGSAKGISAPPGEAEWLSGGSMAFRREVFDTLRFNEKMETFGPYAMAEDIEFSHRVFRSFGKPLIISNTGHVIHRPSPGERVTGTDKKAAMFFYNRYLLMLAASPEHPVAGHIAFLWTTARLLIKLSRSFGTSTAFRGLKMAVRQVRRDKTEKTTTH